jgi:hypothetical protein
MAIEVNELREHLLSVYGKQAFDHTQYANVHIIEVVGEYFVQWVGSNNPSNDLLAVSLKTIENLITLAVEIIDNKYLMLCGFRLRIVNYDYLCDAVICQLG